MGISINVVIGRICRLVLSRGVHPVTIIVHVLSSKNVQCVEKHAMCPTDSGIPPLDSVYDVIYTCLVSDPCILLRLWSRRMMPHMMRSMFNSSGLTSHFRTP